MVRDKNELYFNGESFYLKVVNSNTLEGIGDTGSVSIVKKVSDRTTFQDGSFHISSKQINDISNNRNVCAELRQGRFGCFGDPEIYPEKLTITSDYNGSFVRLLIAFKELNISTYNVVDFCTFVGGSASQVYASLESPEFESFLGPNRGLIISGGSITVKSKTEENFVVSGVLVSNEGYEFSFSVEVYLTNPDFS